MKLVLVLVCAAATARAQPPPPAGDPADAALQEGRRLYDLHEWDAAIAKFKESYRLRPDPAPLFNIAQAYRLDGDCREASSFYKTYARNYPDAPNIAVVERFIAELEPCVKPSEPVVTTPQTDRISAPPPAPRAAPRTPGAHKRVAGLGVAGGGIALLATGVGFGLYARARSREVETGAGVWDPGIERSGERAELTSRVLFGIGAAALVGGGVLHYLGRRDDRLAGIAIAPSTRGATLVWQCAF